MTIDWQMLETEYVTSNMSYPQLAKKYAPSPDEEKKLFSKIKKVGRKNNWCEKRTTWRTEAVTNGIRNVAEAIADKQVKLATKVYDTALILTEKLMTDIQRKESFKAFEYKNFSESLVNLAKLITEQQGIERDDKSGGIVMMVARTDEDEE